MEKVTNSLEIVGIGTVPNYDKPISNPSDTAVDSSTFCLIFITNDQYESIKNDLKINAEEYSYVYRLGDNIKDEDLKKKLEGDNLKDNKLIQFIKAEDNSKIEAAAEDVQANKSYGLLAGIIVLGIFAYVISVFVVHQIENESSIIAVLYICIGSKKEKSSYKNMNLKRLFVLKLYKVLSFENNNNFGKG